MEATRHACHDHRMVPLVPLVPEKIGGQKQQGIDTMIFLFPDRQPPQKTDMFIGQPLIPVPVINVFPPQPPKKKPPACGGEHKPPRNFLGLKPLETMLKVGIGAMIGTLIQPGLGTALGAMIGLIASLF